MNKENIKNIEFINSKIIDTLNRLSGEYSMPFDTLVNLAAMKFINDVNLLRMLRTGNLNLDCLSEKVLF